MAANALAEAIVEAWFLYGNPKLVHYLLRSGREAECCDQSLCRSGYLQNHVTDIRHIFVRVIPVAVAQIFFAGVVLYVLSVLWMTSCLLMIGFMEQATHVGRKHNVIRRTAVWIRHRGV